MARKPKAQTIDAERAELLKKLDKVDEQKREVKAKLDALERARRKARRDAIGLAAESVGALDLDLALIRAKLAELVAAHKVPEPASA